MCFRNNHTRSSGEEETFDSDVPAFVEFVGAIDLYIDFFREGTGEHHLALTLELELVNIYNTGTIDDGSPSHKEVGRYVLRAWGVLQVRLPIEDNG